ncbi:MAG: MFS transporter, partial [Desulfococcus multivorans]|nr:MFS transporter [Desulfococcus multivorans]
MTTDAMRNVLLYRWLIFILLSFGYILVYFHRLCPAVLAVDIMEDLSAGGSMTGLLGSAYFYPYALMQLPAGLLSDSWGPRRTITVFFVVAAGGAVVMGFSTTVAWAIIGRTIVGVGAAMLFVPTLKILAEWFRKREFAYMTGLLLAMGGVGTLIATTPLVWLSNRVGWRNAFTLVGGLTLIMAVLVGIFVRNRPGDLGWPSPLEPSPSAGCPGTGLAAGMKTVLTCPAFWPLAVWFFFDFGIFFAIAGLWGGPYLVHVYGMSRAETGHILVMLAVGLVVGAPAVSWLSDRVFRRRKPVLMLCATGMLLVIGILALKTAAIPLW